MFTVYYNSKDKGHNIKTFEQEMLNICQSHKNENRALAFAFLIYDFHNPQLRQVLNDSHYWMALNEISGKYLTVFSIDYNPKSRKRIRKKSNFRRIQYLTSIATINNPHSDLNKLAEKYFDGTNLSFPSILFFQVHDEVVTDSLMIELNEETVEQSFLEIKGYIKSAVDAMEKVTNENRGNFKEIFDLIVSNLKAKKAKVKFKLVRKKFGDIIGLLSSIKELLG